jgi:DNA-binding Lrp family transcriptional regulator
MASKRPKLLLRLVETSLENPDRMMLSALISEGPISAAELAARTGLSAGKVRRELRHMRAEDLIESVEEKTRRGTVERFYIVSGELVMLEDELAQLSIDQRRRFYAFFLKIALTEAGRMMVSKPTPGGVERNDAPFVRVVMHLDEEGWRELVRIHIDAYEQVIEARNRVADRLNEKRETGFRATSILMFYESEEQTQPI